MKKQHNSKLILLQEIHSTELEIPLKDWEYDPEKELYLVVDLFIGTNDGTKRGNYFHVPVVTPATLYKLPKGKRKAIVLEYYRYDLLLDKIESIWKNVQKRAGMILVKRCKIISFGNMKITKLKI
ncbi:hypothetical protein [Listeria monocytogenes]|uniref:hypothetical protein n=1 Tax=Listeria monocytogenes TaxID=1639 RepID=UPI001F41D867|nr:hypothetical protein [Listeria monocytogenes]